DEYDAAKVMGLASFGDPLYFSEPWERLVQVGADFTIDDDVVRFRCRDFSPLEELFGLPRRTEPIQEVDANNQPYADVAAGLQRVTEETVLALAQKAAEVHPKHLCVSGGVALNCVANGRLLREGPFDEVFIEPACNDGGTAIGAAYYIHNCLRGGERVKANGSAYLGPSFARTDSQDLLDAQGLRYDESDDVERRVAELIAEGYVIGWFQGGMEIGPRALGNRSILADPRSADTVTRLNNATKHREPFRPFCPSVLEEHAHLWFDCGEKLDHPARYMLSTYDARPEKRDAIPAVVHVDGTARMQAVSKTSNPRYYRLIEAFYQLTAVPMVLNTSFNDQEPIVCTPEDALQTFLKTQIDYLVMDDFIVAKQDNLVATTVPDVPLETYFEKLR
ncbi:MAG: carbamoyltransferase C-terminal domain-containing protein, partial [Acidobacteriota bacterium]